MTTIPKDHLIGREFRINLAKDEIVVRGARRAKALVLREMARHVHNECLGCESASFDAYHDHLRGSTSYMARCSQTVCARAGRDCNGNKSALYKAERAEAGGKMWFDETANFAVESDTVDEFVLKIAPKNKDLPQAFGSGAW